MDKVIRYRIYPDKEQLNKIIGTIGCCRFVYNQALNWKKLAYEADGTRITYNDCAYGVTRIKKMYPWLKEADSAALQQSLRDLESAFKRFFTVKGTGYPKFKSKHHSRMSYRTVNNQDSLKILERSLVIPKLGPVRAVIHRSPEEDWRLTSCTVSIEADGSVYASCHFAASEVQKPECVDVRKVIGLDYKSDGLYMDSLGNVCDNPKNYRDSQKKLAFEQRKLKHKTVGSKNYEKQKKRIGKVHCTSANRRKDFLHKESLRIAKSYDLVCVEDLNMKELSRHAFGNGKATMDNAYGMFLTMLEYKLQYRGKKLIRVDKWYPSSQICHSCGERNTDVKDLRIRKWKCPKCGETHDRDRNAALNIRNEGIRMYLGI